MAAERRFLLDENSDPRIADELASFDVTADRALDVRFDGETERRRARIGAGDVPKRTGGSPASEAVRTPLHRSRIGEYAGRTPMAEIEKTEGVLGGKARFAGRRVSVFQIGEMYTRGSDTLEELADQLDLSLAEVHAALAYYYDHPDEMEELANRRDELEAVLEAHSKAPEELTR